MYFCLFIPYKIIPNWQVQNFNPLSLFVKDIVTENYEKMQQR